MRAPRSRRCGTPSSRRACRPHPPDAVNVLAGTRDGERLVAESVGAQAPGVIYPAGLHARKAGRRGRAGELRLRLVVLAKHGLVVGARRARKRIGRPFAWSMKWPSSSTSRRPGWLAPAARPRSGRATRGPPRFAAGSPADAARRGVERGSKLSSWTCCRQRRARSLRDAEKLVTIGAELPRSFVQTRRVRSGAVRSRVRGRSDAGGKDPTGTGVDRDENGADVDRHADETTVRRSRCRVVLIQHLGPVGVGTTTTAARLSGDLYDRAIEVMAGAHALGGFTPLHRRRELRSRVLALELDNCRLLHRRPSSRPRSLSSPRRGRHRRSDRRHARPRRGVHRRLRPRRRWCVRCSRGLGENGVAVGGDVTSEDALLDASAAAVEASAASTSSS